MLDGELLQILVQHFLTDPSLAHTLEGLEDDLAYSRLELLKSISRLLEAGILEKMDEDKTYVINTKLKAINIVKAAQFGLDLTPFESMLGVNDDEKCLALDISLQMDKIKSDQSSRSPILQKDFAFLHNSKKQDAVLENLLCIYDAVNSSLYQYVLEMAKKDDHLNKLLLLHSQAEESVKSYIKK